MQENQKNSEVLLWLDESNWISDTWLSIIEQDSLTYEAILKTNNINYNKELLRLFKDSKRYLTETINIIWDKQIRRIEKERLLHKLVSKIWILANHHETDSFSYRTKDRPVLWTLEINFKTWENCILAPWCLPNIKKIIDLWIIDKNNVNIKLWNWVNFQEWICITKSSWELWNIKTWKFDNENDNLSEISITSWDNCSFPHWISFYPWTRNDVIVELWNHVFLWINTLIWSWTTIWNNTTIWWGSQLWNNVTIWDNVIIWQKTTIEDDVKIEANCLITNFSKITKWYKIVPFEEYEKNPNKYVWNRNFVIQISTNEKEKERQLSYINWHYNFIDRFNNHNVVPENKIFAAIEEVLNFLENKLWYVKSEVYCYNTNFEILKRKLNEKEIDIDLDELNFWIDWKSRLVVKVYPKDAESFLLEEMPIILEDIITAIENNTLEQEKQWLISKIDKLMDKPLRNFKQEIWDNFFWDCYITWKFETDKNSTFVNLRSRWDELKENETVQIKDSTIFWWVIHWSWDKNINNTVLYNTTAHWWVNYRNSEIWEIWRRSVLNSTIVKDSIILWNTTINWANIKDSKIDEWVAIAWWWWNEWVIIDNSQIWNCTCINTWTEIYNSTIEENKKIWKNLIIKNWETSVKR